MQEVSKEQKKGRADVSAEAFQGAALSTTLHD